MTRDVVSVHPNTALKDVAAILCERHISGVPVISSEGDVVGVVSEGDILFKERGPSDGRRPLSWLVDPYEKAEKLKLEARTAGEAMTAPAKTIASWRSISAAAAQMLEQHVNRLPVVDDDELVGIVTRADLVRAFARTDEEIEREIREEVVHNTLWIAEPERVTVAVHEGTVTLGGWVDTRADADLVAKHAAKVAGVVNVESSIGWVDEDGRLG